MTEQINYEPGQILEALNDKADADCRNLSADGRRMISGQGKPSERFITLIPSEGGTYKAPANGWFSLGATATAAASAVILYNDARRVYVSSQYANASGKGLGVMLPVRKSDTVSLSYININAPIFSFNYDEGENQ